MYIHVYTIGLQNTWRKTDRVERKNRQIQVIVRYFTLPQQLLEWVGRN